MKKKDLQDLGTKSESEIEKRIKELETKLVNGKLEMGLGRIKNVHEIKQLRVDIARSKTILAMKILAQVIKEPASGTGES